LHAMPPYQVTLVDCGSHQLLWEVEPSRFNELPHRDWHPDSDSAPPLALNRACAIAKATFKTRRPEVYQADVASVGLWQIRSTNGPSAWCYVVDFSTRATGGALPSAYDTLAVVLMDGTALEPKIVKLKK